MRGAPLATALPPHRRSPDSRCSGSSCRRDARGFARGSARRRAASSSCAVSSMPGVQKPHCSALRATNASCRSAISSVSVTPSMVSTRAPSHCTASMRQPRTTAPSTRTLQAPQHAVLAADMAAGERQRPRAGNPPASCAHRRRARTSSPLTVSDDVVNAAFADGASIELARRRACSSTPAR